MLWFQIKQTENKQNPVSYPSYLKTRRLVGGVKILLFFLFSGQIWRGGGDLGLRVSLTEHSREGELHWRRTNRTYRLKRTG